MILEISELDKTTTQMFMNSKKPLEFHDYFSSQKKEVKKNKT